MKPIHFLLIGLCIVEATVLVLLFRIHNCMYPNDRLGPGLQIVVLMSAVLSTAAILQSFKERKP
jgi:hypothetical protein